VKEFLEELPGDLGDPLPVEEQVGNNGRAKRDAQPFMQGIAGQMRVRHHQKSGEDGEIEEEIGFG
jgi:hypothetical protein